ncbi:MAG: hypothetical protein IT384_16100 [Deltaproteobacteria bacterium]|nr:hypothetical protein [Deltaproteobacteria bacterium]
MEETRLHPLAARTLDALTEDAETGTAIFAPGIAGLGDRLSSLEPIDLGHAVYDLTGILLKLLEAPSLHDAANDLARELNRPDFVRAYQAFLTEALKRERASAVASADAFGRFRGGETPSSSVQAEPRDELLKHLPVRG